MKKWKLASFIATVATLFVAFPTVSYAMNGNAPLIAGTKITVGGTQYSYSPNYATQLQGGGYYYWDFSSSESHDVFLKLVQWDLYTDKEPNVLWSISNANGVYFEKVVNKDYISTADIIDWGTLPKSSMYSVMLINQTTDPTPFNFYIYADPNAKYESS